MPIDHNDIVQLLSGGISNTNPNLSLGGVPSTTIILDSINNLFDNVTEDEALAGRTEYRCFYLYNNTGPTDLNPDLPSETLYRSELLISNQVDDGSNVEIGVYLNNEIQVISITGSVTGGSFDIIYNGGDPQTVDYDSDINVWANNIQEALSNYIDLDGIIVTATNLGYIKFDVFFEGQGAKRNHSLLEIDNNLIGSPTISVSKASIGGPINYDAPEIGFEQNPPGNVNFGFFNEESPIYIGDFRGRDYIGVWIKRIVASGTDAKVQDGVTIRLKGYLA